MTKERVVVTGLGPISAVGTGKDAVLGRNRQRQIWR
jgi:hypothetical protein